MAALAAALLPVAASAGPGLPGGLAQGSSLALPLVSLASTTPAITTVSPATVELATPFVGGVRYRPRGSRGGGYMVPTTTQIHGGFFDPTHNFSTGFNGGFRIGPQIDPNVQIGVAVDWWHKSQSERTSLGMVPLPGGGASEELILSRSTADLMPILAFVQVSGDENMSVIPYAGVGAGYEWLFLTADDFTTGESFDQTFGGFGWQVWGGAGIPLSGRTRVNGEVFYNGSEVGSDVDVFFQGVPVTVRDVVKMDGVGMRFGISWGF
jgi:hypothetical protein